MSTPWEGRTYSLNSQPQDSCLRPSKLGNRHSSMLTRRILPLNVSGSVVPSVLQSSVSLRIVLSHFASLPTAVAQIYEKLTSL